MWYELHVVVGWTDVWLRDHGYTTEVIYSKDLNLSKDDMDELPGRNCGLEPLVSHITPVRILAERDVPKEW